jgi:outer membrane biosynthesis protein TonB
MTASIENLPYIARQQEQQRLIKILAGGISGSLLFHGIAAIAYNYLPKQATAPIEVTFVNADEIPPELLPTPSTPPTPTPTLTAQVNPSITPLPAVTPSVSPTPSPSVTPIVKKTPPTKPSVDPTPQEVKTATNPTQLVLPIPEPESPAKILENSSPSNSREKSSLDKSVLNGGQAISPTERKEQVDSKTSRIPGVNLGALNTGQSAGANRTATALSKGSAQVGGDEIGGEDQGSFDPTGGRGIQPGRGIIGSNSGTLARAGNGSSSFGGGNAGNGGDSAGGDGAFPDLSPAGGSGRRGSGLNSGSNSGALASSRGSSFNSLVNGDANVGNDDSEGFAANYIPGRSSGSRSGLGNDGGNSLALTAPGNKPGSGLGDNSNNGMGNGGDSSIGSGEPVAGNARGLVTGFGTGLECLANCAPQYLDEIEREAMVKVAISLDDNGKVIRSKLKKSSQNRKLDNFTETEFSKMQFKIPPDFRKRDFIVFMKFKETSR